MKLENVQSLEVILKGSKCKLTRNVEAGERFILNVSTLNNGLMLLPAKAKSDLNMDDDVNICDIIDEIKTDAFAGIQHVDRCLVVEKI